MIPLRKTQNILIEPEKITELLKKNYSSLMQSFYEMQSGFLSGVYKRYGSIETANIILCFAKNAHLEIIRQREKDLNIDVSLQNFWNNFYKIRKPYHKISTVVKLTGIPKETVRRKIKNLINVGYLNVDKINKGYYWNLASKDKEAYVNIINEETKNLSMFIAKIVKLLDIKLPTKLIDNEIQSQFSFYWYHYLTCQLEWLKWWQLRLRDNDLLIISLQAIIPTLNFLDKKNKEIDLDNLFKIIGQVNKEDCTNCAINATSISAVTGIPRATCIRKLEKLVALGFLTRVEKNKRFEVNQAMESRTKNILSKENVNFTIKNFSDYISIILNSLIYNKM